MRLGLGGLVLAVMAALACGSAVPGVDDDGGAPDAPGAPQPDAGVSNSDAGAPAAVWPSVVLVDGIVNGQATFAGTALTLGDIRVCIADAQTGQWLTPYAVPDQQPMPLANYPGVRRGTGIDLGSFQSAGAVNVDVYGADDLSDDAAWVANRTGFECGTISCTTAGKPCHPHVRITATVAPDVTVLGVVDGSAAGIQAAPIAFEDRAYQGTPGSLYAAFLDLTAWHAADTISVSYGAASVASLLPGIAVSPTAVTDSLASYETPDLVYAQGADQFGQSLDSIAFVSNPTVTPAEFYAVRENFVVALVGDPNDTTSVQQNGGRDPQFDGKGLHLTAVPYAAPRAR